jgi:hypothetical protein
MTSAPAATSEMDPLDQLGAKSVDAFQVRKDLVRQYAPVGALSTVAPVGALNAPFPPHCPHPP